MPQHKLPLFFDTVVLSNFAFVDGGLLFLKKRYQKRGRMTLQVIQEIKKATYIDYPQLEHIEKQIISKQGFQKISLSEKEQEDYLLLLRNLGEGEGSKRASVVVVAHCRMLLTI